MLSSLHNVFRELRAEVEQLRELLDKYRQAPGQCCTEKSGLDFRHGVLTFASGGMTDDLARAEIEAKINSSKDACEGGTQFVCVEAHVLLQGESTMMELSMSWEQKVDSHEHHTVAVKTSIVALWHMNRMKNNLRNQPLNRHQPQCLLAS